MKKYKYDVTVIIPIYNSERYLEKCIKSVIAQTYRFSKIEVLLINDGSTDNSEAICQRYAAQYPNIRLISQKNQGVSSARNKGINQASGKYIMLLDSDDYLSRRTIKNLISFFDNNYEKIDLVTYPLYFCKNGRRRKSPRYKLYDKGTGIYDVNEYIYLDQSTINIMFKNDEKDRCLFDVNMDLSEDQNFDTELVKRKEKIGFVREAIYYYRQHGVSSSATKNYPYYCFENFTSYFERLIKKYKNENGVHRYIQGVIVSTLKWRVRDDLLIPHHYEGKKFDDAMKRIKKIVSTIDDDVIVNCPNTDILYKQCILKLKGDKLAVRVDDENHYDVVTGNVSIEKEKDVKCTITRFKSKNGQLSLMGTFKSALFLAQAPEAFINIVYDDGQIKKEKLAIIANNFVHSDIINVYGFNLRLDTKNIKELSFYVLINNKEIPLKFDYDKFTTNRVYDHKVCLVFKGNKLKLISKNILTLINGLIYDLANTRIYKYPAFIYKFINIMYFNRNKVWLYSDKSGNFDNAYVQFKHDFNKRDGIDRYYVYNDDFDKIKDQFSQEEQKKLLKFRSFKHKMLFLKAQKIITSFIDLQVYCPYNKGIQQYRSMVKYDLVYLQHGILHAKLLKMYSKEFTEIDKFIVSTNFEVDNLIKNYHYDKDDLILSGMPRMENESLKGELQNKILYAPSWRKYLIGDLIRNKRELKVNEFLKSNFFKKNYALLHSQELEKILKKENLILEFKLHPIFKEYVKYFDLNELTYINLNFDETNVSEYKLFITDFSSFQFDFVKLRRPIIYFVPDMVEFKAGLHSYRELDLNYKDAFGNLCLDEKELLKEIDRVIKNNFQPEKVFVKRMNNFFLKIDHPCDKIYSLIRDE